MKTCFPIAGIAALVALFGADTARADMLKVLPQGRYECALPGDATGAAYEAIENGYFRIDNASTYDNADGRGTYLLRDEIVTFTRGPLKGKRFRRTGENMLREVKPDGSLGPMRCARRVR